MNATCIIDLIQHVDDLSVFYKIELLTINLNRIESYDIEKILSFFPALKKCTLKGNNYINYSEEIKHVNPNLIIEHLK